MVQLILMENVLINKYMNKKKIIILSSLLLVLIVVIVLLFTLNNNNKENEGQKEYTPMFLNEEQKQEFGLNPETRAQVFYDDKGKAIYRIIRKDSDIITNPEAVDSK
jgi:flagellar basal body-associated protein FliL